MHKHQAQRRGIMFARAEAPETAKVMAELQRAFEAFKATNDERLAALAKGQADVVTSDKLTKINAEIDRLQTALDDANRAIAAQRTGGANVDGDNVTPEVRAARREHRAAFESFFRRGENQHALNDLSVKAALQVGVNPDGGYTAPVEMDTAITRVLMNVSAMRSLATVRTISAQAFKKLVNVGGATSGWVGETTSRTETNTPSLRALEFPAMELYANPAATQQLLDDSFVNIEQWLADEVATEFAEEEGAAFISGAGVNSPRGILGYTPAADASYAWGNPGYIATGTSANFDATNPADAILDLIYALKKGYRQNATFLMNRKTLAAVRKLKDGDGFYLWQPSAQAGQPSSLMGYPVEDDDNMTDIAANSYSIAFADFARAYVIVDRTGTRVQRDPYTNKPFVMFYTTKRVGGGIQNFEAIKLLKFGTS